MSNLGFLEDEQGDMVKARRWYGEAIATGHADAAPKAMVNLGGLEHEQGNLGEARRWWEQAIATGHADQAPEAMVNLGVLEYEQGNLSEARRRYGQAIATDHPKTALRAEQQLRDLDRLEDERRRAEQFGRYGWQAYADPQMMKPRSARPETDQPAGDEGEPSSQ
jgi:Tfp pilus assembly protein PilF